MSRPRLTEFVADDGTIRELRDPDGQPTGAQLRKLNRLGMLDLVPHAYAIQPLTKAEAAAALSDARRSTGE